jgi:nucleotide-binding universal stress UspA family protein
VSCLIEVHPAAPSARALYEAVSRLARCGSVCLLHTVASGRPAEVEAGKRFLLETGRALRRLDRRLIVDARLEIGDAAARLLQVAEEIRPELIVVSAHGEGEFPRLEAIGRTARAVLEWGRLPVLLVSPEGGELCRPRPLRPRAHTSFSAPRPSRCRAPGSLQTPAASL